MIHLSCTGACHKLCETFSPPTDRVGVMARIRILFKISSICCTYVLATSKPCPILASNKIWRFFYINEQNTYVLTCLKKTHIQNIFLVEFILLHYWRCFLNIHKSEIFQIKRKLWVCKTTRPECKYKEGHHHHLERS